VTPKQPCVVCGAPSDSPLCYRDECLKKWKAMMGEAKP
jgi:hypothetical protein